MQHEAACRAESGSTACVVEGAAKPDVVGKCICTFPVILKVKSLINRV